MVGCCKFGPCRKKRTYEFNNPPYTENKEDGVYHSHKQKLTQNQTQNASAAVARTNPAFESASADNVEFNGAAVVNLDSECNSIAEETGAIARKESKHKENAEGFKSADLVVAGGVKRKDSKRSSKSSHSSSSSSSKSSKRSSKHSADVVVKDNAEDNISDHKDEVVEASVDDIHADVQAGESYTTVTTTTITTTTETHETHGDEEVEIEGGAVAYPDDEHHDHDETTKVSEVVVITREEITTVSEDGAAVTRVEVTEEVINDTGGDKTPERRKSDSSHSSSSSSSSDANSYRVNEDEVIANVNEENEETQDEEVSAAAAAAGAAQGSGSTSGEESSGGIEPPPGIEELDNEANDMVEIRDGSYNVTHVTEEVTVNAHGDNAEHGDTGSEDL